ncbi:hypothetical protein BJ912DRAFT_420111 [Pholiota molesta]|nr:hypothetical protein BJ912DRAFT_420111 [Pholiota molesta]
MDASDLEIANSLAATQLISTIVNWGLFGVLSVQVFLFSQAFPNDRPIFKAMVYGTYLVETAQTIALTVSTWATFVKGGVSTFTAISVSVSLLEAVTAMVVQTFYAYRIMIISENKIIPSFIMLMSLTSFIAQVVVSVIIGQADNFEIIQLHTLKTSDFIGIWIGTGCACDIAIAACMCFYLNRRIRDGIFPKTQALVTRVMRMTIETGALTASVSIVLLALFYAPALKGLIYYSVPISTLAKLYSNTMLALLNSRIKLGIISESTTWQDNAFSHIPLSQPRQTGALEIKFAAVNTLKDETGIELRDGVIAIDEA